MRHRSLWLVAAVAAVAAVAMLGGSLSPPTASAAPTTLRACTASDGLVPDLGAVTINQGLGSYASEKLVRGKETLVRFFLKLPGVVGTTCSGSINVINTSSSPTRMTLIDPATPDDGDTFTGDLPDPIAPYQTYPSAGTAISSSSVSVNSSADPIFVVPASRVNACNATPCSITTPFTLQFKARIYYTTSANSTPTFRDFSLMPGTTSTPIAGNFSQLPNAFRVLVIPMGDKNQLYSSQFTSTGQQAVQSGFDALSRMLPVPAGVTSTLRTTSGGIRYWINLAAMLDLKAIPGAYPSGSTKFCGTQQNFDGTAANSYQDGIRAKLAWYLQTYNSNPDNAAYPADRVLGVVDSAISDGSTSSLTCAEGFASTISPEAWVRAIPDKPASGRTAAVPSMTGSLMAMELVHTLGQENVAAGFVHSTATVADGTAPDRGYHITSRSFIANDRTALNFVNTSTAPWNNNSTLLELGAFERALCNFGGVVSPVNFQCTSPSQIGTDAAPAGTGHFVISATTDGTAANTAVTSSQLLQPQEEAQDDHPILETPCLASSQYNLAFYTFADQPGSPSTVCYVPTSGPVSEHDADTRVISTRLTIAGAFPSPGGVTKVELRKGTTVLHTEIVQEGGLEIVGASLNPGSSFTQTKTITTPEILPKPDVYFLADTTGSMGPALANVKTNASSILDRVKAEASEPRFGAGDYKDFRSCGSGETAPCFADGYAFNNAAPIPASDDDGAAALAAIGGDTSGWQAGGGLDAPEGQLYALQQLTDPLEAGWRDDSSRILVWFGDNPGHDPVCAAISGDTSDVTHVTLTSALRDANIRIIAVSLDTDGEGPFSTGLNGNLTAESDVDYDAACGDSPPSSPQQANSFANATGGVVKEAASAEEVSNEILAGLTNLPAEVKPVATCQEGLSISFDPTRKTVTSGEDASFAEHVTVSAGATLGDELTCNITFLINDKEVLLDDGVTPDPRFKQTVTVPVDNTSSSEVKISTPTDAKADIFIECDGGQLPGQVALPAASVAGSISTFVINADTTNACAGPGGSDPQVSVLFTDGSSHELISLDGAGATSEGGQPAKPESPTASIYAPAPNFVNPVNQPFALNGQVFDPDDGPLDEPPNPSWTITGPAGSGILLTATGNFADVSPPAGTWPLGDYTVRISGTDSDDNEAHASVIVHVRSYVFSGFLPPIRPLPTVNDGKVKSTIPIKWQLRDQAGNFITDLGVVAAIRVGSTPCPSAVTVCDVTPTGGTMLRYDTKTNQYVYNWLTPSTPGTYVVSVHFTDGTTYAAYFKLTK
jgi:hypothetical protein